MLGSVYKIAVFKKKKKLHPKTMGHFVRLQTPNLGLYHKCWVVLPPNLVSSASFWAFYLFFLIVVKKNT